MALLQANTYRYAQKIQSAKLMEKFQCHVVARVVEMIQLWLNRWTVVLFPLFPFDFSTVQWQCHGPHSIVRLGSITRQRQRFRHIHSRIQFIDKHGVGLFCGVSIFSTRQMEKKPVDWVPVVEQESVSMFKHSWTCTCLLLLLVLLMTRGVHTCMCVGERDYEWMKKTKSDMKFIVKWLLLNLSEWAEHRKWSNDFDRIIKWQSEH